MFCTLVQAEVKSGKIIDVYCEIPEVAAQGIIDQCTDPAFVIVKMSESFCQEYFNSPYNVTHLYRDGEIVEVAAPENLPLTLPEV